MRLSDNISEAVVCLNMKGLAKDEAIRELAELLRASPQVRDFDVYLKDVFAREQMGTTGIGEAVAIPHARTDAVTDFVIAIGRSSKGIDFSAVDGAPVKLIVMMGTPLGQVGEYLKILAHLCYLLKRNGFIESLMQAPDRAAVAELFRNNEDV